MLRGILGAIAGYIVMVAAVMIGVWLLWSIVGPGGAFDGEGPYPSTVWLVCNVVLSFAAAALGGMAALKVGRTGAVKILVGLILVIGFLMAFLRLGVEPEAIDKPVAELTFFEAGGYAEPPAWYNWAIPLIGAAGVLLGGREKP